MKSDLLPMLEVLGNYNALINRWEVYGSEGLQLFPAWGSNAVALSTAIEPDVVAHKWHIDMRRSAYILIEPDLTESVQLGDRRYLFHVARKDARRAIQGTGLRLSTGGTTRLDRTYPPRVHFALNLEAAFRFIRFQCYPRSGIPEINEDELDLWRIRVDSNLAYREDLHFHGESVWSDVAVPSNCLTRLRAWPLRRKLLSALTARGLV